MLLLRDLKKLIIVFIFFFTVVSIGVPCYALRQPAKQSHVPTLEETLIETVSRAHAVLATSSLEPRQRGDLQALVRQLEDALAGKSLSRDAQIAVRAAISRARAICGTVPIKTQGPTSFRTELLTALQNGRAALRNMMPGNRDYQALSSLLSRLETASQKPSYSIDEQKQLQQLMAQARAASVPGTFSRPVVRTQEASS